MTALWPIIGLVGLFTAGMAIGFIIGRFVESDRNDRHDTWRNGT